MKQVEECLMQQQLLLVNRVKWRRPIGRAFFGSSSTGRWTAYYQQPDSQDVSSMGSMHFFCIHSFEREVFKRDGPYSFKSDHLQLH